MRCETCQGMGTSYKLAHIIRVDDAISPGPCPDCNGSGISHCCDGIQEQRDPGDETPDHHDSMVAGLDEICPDWFATRHMNPLQAAIERAKKWPDWLGEMERGVTGCADNDWPKRWMEQKLPEPTGCADDCCHPSHRHGAVSIWPESVGPVTLRMKIPGMSPPDTHDEWRKLNEGDK